MYAGGNGGRIIYMGSVHSHEASKLKAAYVTAKHGLLACMARLAVKEGGPKGVTANVMRLAVCCWSRSDRRRRTAYY